MSGQKYNTAARKAALVVKEAKRVLYPSVLVVKNKKQQAVAETQVDSSAEDIVAAFADADGGQELACWQSGHHPSRFH